MRMLLISPLLIVMLISSMCADATDVVRYNISETYPEAKQAYYIDLLTLILAASSEQYGDFKLSPVLLDMSQGRASAMLQQGRTIDVAWRMTSQALEQDLQAIYIPLLKGLMGVRIAVIRKSDSAIFSSDVTLDKLKKMSLGQGYDWPDSDILRANGFDVVEGRGFSLLTMLEKHRFDYFPRAIHEPWLEIADKEHLAVEQHFLLRYPAPMYFFTKKENRRLAQRIEYGFTRIVDSGAFEQFFFQHPVTQNMFLKANLPQRKVFMLDNPLLSDKSRAILSNKSLWLDCFH